MNNEIQPFEFEGSQVRTAQDDNGNPLFCGNDVAQVLGYANPAKAVIDHCKGFPFWKPLETAGGIQRVRFISEGDMYRLITSSKLPAAERFEKWVYDEVLPSIRKHGAYMTQQTLDKALTSPDFLIQLATKLKEEQEKVKELEPKAKALDDFTNIPDALLVRDAAKLLSNNSNIQIGEHELRQWLVDNGWIYRQSNQSWCAASSRVRQGHMVMVSSRSHGIHKDGTPFAYPPTPKLTRKGLALIHQRLSEQSFERVLDAEVAA